MVTLNLIKKILAPQAKKVKIRQYIVERREEGKKAWTKCACVEQTYADITGLKTGGSYEFRICSEDFHANHSVYVAIRDELVTMGRVVSEFII